MPKMEKGRPPENKRSRKPAHPVKREVSQELKSFAESTMNELLGWYGYDKVDLQESESSDVRSYSNRARRHHISVLKENSDPKPAMVERKVSSTSSASAKNGGRESTGFPLSPSSSSSSPHMKELHSPHVVVPLIKPSAVDDQHSIQIVCVWCQKEGVKRYSLIMGSELKSFCSEKCFAMCRRAYFKRNKARDEDRHNDQSPPPSDQTTEAPPRLVHKLNSNTRVCDWCKHVRHTKYLDLGAGEERLQFCSTKCLNQYKMDIFYREARAALKTTSNGSSPSHLEKESQPGTGAIGESQALLTPESWDNHSLEGENKALLAKEAPIPASSAVSVISSAASSSSAVEAPVPTQPQKEQESLGSSQLQSGRAAPCLQNSPIFLRPPLNAQGLRSPIHKTLRNPASSPIQRSPHLSPHIQAPSIRPLPPPHLLHPYTGPVLPFTTTYPHPIPPLIPSLSPPCPQPTLLVPYPIIVPLPVPVPIPIPIPLNSGVSGQTSVIRNHEKKGKRGTDIASVTPEKKVDKKISENTEIVNHSLAECTVKVEQSPSPSDSSQDSSAHAELSATLPLPAVLTIEQRDESKERQVIQRVFHQHPVKQEPETQVRFEQREAEQGPGWNTLEDEDDSTAQQSPKCDTDTLAFPSMRTHCSDLTHTLTTSLILRKALISCSNNAASVVTPIVLNNTVATPLPVPCSTNLTTFQTTSVSSDRPDTPSEHRTHRAHVQAPPTDSEEVKENFLGGYVTSLNCCCSGKQTDCQTNQSKESKTGKTESDALTADEEHTYARSIPPKLREKNAHTITLTAAQPLSPTIMHTWDLHTHLHGIEQSDMHLDAEPALKRRCLRIREKNK